MSKTNSEESYYQLLRVSPKASVSEITSAYLSAKNAFSKDSIATYSLMAAEDTTDILSQLETAYMTLTNPDKRRDYDKRLNSAEIVNLEVARPNPESQISQETNKKAQQTPVFESAPVVANSNLSESHSFDKDTGSDAPLNHLNTGEFNLSQIRESKGLTLTDVSRITKIPVKYLKALEERDKANLPAKVYIQGFLKNLAQLYRLDPKTAVSQYLMQLEQTSGPTSP